MPDFTPAEIETWGRFNGRGSRLDAVVARLESVENGHWIWTGQHSNGGRGYIEIGGRRVSLRAWLYEHILGGALPKGARPRVTCGFAPCHNPTHLRIEERAPQGESVEARLLRYRRVMPDGCWEWTAASRRNGYGAITIEGRSRPVHRLAYEVWRGEIAEGLFVCHSCDNRLCFRPDHLWLGTNADNLADMAAKGRANNSTTWITDEQVAELRRVYRRYGKEHAALARKWGISQSWSIRIAKGEGRR